MALRVFWRRTIGRKVLLPLGSRLIRTGYFPDDHDFIDPEDPLLSEPLNARWRNMDDPTLQNRILERSNVGMGMLVINRVNGFDLPCVNELYKRLRNLEVNSLKRFVGLAAMEPGPFSIGLDPKELLLAAVWAQKKGDLSNFSRALLWNSQELAHLVADYRKPLVCQLSGFAQDGGAALACLSSFSGAHENSIICVRACRHGLVPMGGMTYLLGSLQWHLGEFLALTGWELRGSDLICLDLVEHWLAPDALPFMELTSEKQLEVSEADAKLLLHEHSLPLPQDQGLLSENEEEGGEHFKRRYIPLIDKIFQCESPKKIREAIDIEQTLLAGQIDKIEDLNFLKECAIRMEEVSAKASWVTLKLIRNAREQIQSFRNQNESNRPIRVDVLVESLGAELWAQQRLLQDGNVVDRLHAACMGREMPRQRDEVLEAEIDNVVTNVPKDFFVVPERSEISLSQHPRLRRYHPDYDPATGLDHDPAWMKQEARRWDPDESAEFAKARRDAVKDLLGDQEDQDPSAFGFSRWVRVESRHA